MSKNRLFIIVLLCLFWVSELSASIGVAIGRKLSSALPSSTSISLGVSSTISSLTSTASSVYSSVKEGASSAVTYASDKAKEAWNSDTAVKLGDVRRGLISGGKDLANKTLTAGKELTVAGYSRLMKRKPGGFRDTIGGLASRAIALVRTTNTITQTSPDKLFEAGGISCFKITVDKIEVIKDTSIFVNPEAPIFPLPGTLAQSDELKQAEPNAHKALGLVMKQIPNLTSASAPDNFVLLMDLGDGSLAAIATQNKLGKDMVPIDVQLAGLLHFAKSINLGGKEFAFKDVDSFSKTLIELTNASRNVPNNQTINSKHIGNKISVQLPGKTVDFEWKNDLERELLSLFLTVAWGVEVPEYQKAPEAGSAPAESSPK